MSIPAICALESTSSLQQDILDQLWLHNEEFRAFSAVQNDLIVERVYECAGPRHIFMEHMARYVFASRYTSGKKVLDMACGSGYGTNYLAHVGRASIACGVDIAPDAVRYAQLRYQLKDDGKYNLKYHCYDATVKWTEELFDIIISFETIEHVPSPDRLLHNISSMLSPDGITIISSPQRLYGTLQSPPLNAFHLREWSMDEFVELLEQFFVKVEIYGQHWDTQNSWGYFKYPHFMQNKRMRMAGFDPSQWEHFVYDVHSFDRIPKWLVTGPPHYLVAVCKEPKVPSDNKRISELCVTTR